MPAIYLLTHDGTKIAVPPESAALSAVLRRALDDWSESFGPPPPPPDEDTDRTLTDTDSARTPDDDTDRTASIIDDCGSRTPSPPPPRAPADSATPSSLDADSAEERSERSPVPAAAPPPAHAHPLRADDAPPGLAAEEWASPRSYHQRTPCMMGDDDEDGLLLRVGRASGEEAAASPGGSSPGGGAADLASPPRVCGRKSGGVFRVGRVGAGEPHRFLGAGDGGALHQLARITDGEIVIELQSQTGTDAPRRGGSPDPGSRRGSSSSDSGGGRRLGRNGSPAAPLLSAAVQLCAEYLCQFADSGAREAERVSPTRIADPLSAPLVALLAEWEREYLYYTILEQTEAQLETAMEIVRCCPQMSFLYPDAFLRRPQVAAALLVSAPNPERVSLLVSVMRAAEVLQIQSLQNMCAAWCADYMLRVSYASIDHFEAAALVRNCFSIKNDWTKKEVDCLKLENEWPVNEEE